MKVTGQADYNQGYKDGIDSMRSKLQTMIDSHLQEMREDYNEDPIIEGWIECLEMYQSEMLSRKWRDYATIKPDEKK